MNAYPMGQTIDLGPWELRDADGDLVVAADEACTLLLPDGTTTNPTVTTPSTGVYTALVTPSQLGLHSFEAILTLSDGSQAVNTGHFRVIASPTVAPGYRHERDLVRIHIGDTNPDAELLTDVEIDLLLDARSGVVLPAAADACDAISAKFARDFDLKWQSGSDVGGEFDRSQMSEMYAERAKALRSQLGAQLTAQPVTRIDGYSDDLSTRDTSASRAGRVRAGYYHPDLPS